jgi:cell wall-associated NlpC family hydrolase
VPVGKLTGPHVPFGQPLLPGDLVFYGTPTHIHPGGPHIGASKMIKAPTFVNRSKWTTTATPETTSPA